MLLQRANRRVQRSIGDLGEVLAGIVGSQEDGGARDVTRIADAAERDGGGLNPSSRARSLNSLGMRPRFDASPRRVARSNVHKTLTKQPASSLS
jgi:hypothetical protein